MTRNDDRPLTGGMELRMRWPIILAAALGVAIGTTGIPYYTLGVFIKPLEAEFGWSRSQIGLGAFFLHSGTFLLSPFLGGIVDRHGPRGIALTSLVGLGIGLALLAASGPSLLSYYAAWIAVAMLGCGTTPLTWTRMIGQNFQRARGLALGMALAGTGFASIFGPRFCAYLIEEFGWRAAYQLIALAAVFLILPAVAYCSRKADKGPGSGNRAELAGVTLRQAVRTRHFALIATGIFCVILAQAGSMVHLVPMLSDRGLDAGEAASMAGLMGFAVITGRLLVGALIDRFHAPRVAVCFVPLPAISMAIMLMGTGHYETVLAILLIGLAAGAEVDLMAYLVSRYFGMRHYGVIYGVNLSIFALGAGIGPSLAGLSFDRTGSYDQAMVAAIAMFLIGATLIGSLGRYPELPGRDGKSG
ncbi:MFS transporter [Croceicoccus mobilis]|uniref:MFS transporter n=1 Tax=Croceicoccus mobilis TaxID=1703339 RepID=A0A916Z754_9SPHN|nr:MFS transporter [Croceicoccus mobilis]GGD79390.1 MFS transporter [Croceicoccus mobilis]